MTTTGSVTAFRKFLDVAVTGKLSELGFVRRLSGVFELRLAGNEAVGWLGLPERVASLTPPAISLAPMVGLRIPAVSTLLAAVTPAATSRYAATVAVPIGRLHSGGRAQAWDFSVGQDNVEELAEMVSSIETLGVPYISRLAADNDSLARVVDETAPQADVILPVLFTVRGQYGKARERLGAVVDSLPNSGPWRDYYLPFSERLFALIREREVS